MLNLSFRDLKYLRGLVSQNYNDRADFVLARIDQELKRVPYNFEIACLYAAKGKPEKDILYLGERALPLKLRELWFDDHLRKIWPDGEAKSVAILCPNEGVAQCLFECFILNETNPARVSTRPWNRAEFRNGTTVDVFSDNRVSACRGRIYDLGIVYTGADHPSA